MREVEISGFAHILLMHMADTEDILDFGVTTASKLNTGFINTHPNSIADFMEREVTVRSEKIKRLVDRASQADRKAYIAAVIEETVETGMNFSLMGAGSYSHITLPDSDVVLPSGLDAFWVIRGDYEVANRIRQAHWLDSIQDTSSVTDSKVVEYGTETCRRRRGQTHLTEGCSH